MLYSCDADGIIKAWDIRKVSEAGTWVHYPHIPANCIEVEKTNNYKMQYLYNNQNYHEKH